MTSAPTRRAAGITRRRFLSRARRRGRASPPSWPPAGRRAPAHRPASRRATGHRRAPSPRRPRRGAAAAVRCRRPPKPHGPAPARSTGAPTGTATWTSTTNDKASSRRSRSSQTKYGITVNYVEIDRRQRDLLRRPASRPARGRPGDRLGPHRPDRLDGRPARPPRLAREDRPRQHAELPANLLDVYKGRSWDPTQPHHARGSRA